MVAATNVVLRQNLVFTVLDVKPRVWKTVDVSSVFAVTAKRDTVVRMSPEIARFMQILESRLKVKCASSTHQTTPRIRPSVMLIHGTNTPWPFHIQWKISESFTSNRCQWIIQFLKIRLTGRNFA